MQVEQLKKKYTVGTQVELIEMDGEVQMPKGLRGTVRFVDDIGQIHVIWENGSSLALNISVDKFSVVTTG